MINASITIPKEILAAFCQRHHIRRLALFGSALTSRFTAESDLDILVTFDPAHIPDLLSFIEMEAELSDLFGRKVDLNTEGFLSRHFRDTVLENAEVIYDFTA